MRPATAVAVIALCAAFTLTASAVSAQRLNGTFRIDGDEATIENFAFLVLVNTDFYVDGVVEGIGTDGDDVRIVYFTETPNQVSVDDAQGRVRQHQRSTLAFTIESGVPERELDLEISPEKCAIDGKVNVPKAKGSVTVSCSGDDIFAEVSASQLTSIQSAFSSTKNVKIKVKSDGSKGTLRISLKGPAAEEPG